MLRILPDRLEFTAEMPEEMILEFNISSDNETLTLPVSAVADGFTPNYSVHWGDNSDWEHFTSDSPSHTYLTAGTYIVTLSGNVSSWGFRESGDKDKLTKVLNFGKCEWKKINGSFNGCGNLVVCVMGNTDTSACTDFRYMFRLVSKLNILDVRGMDCSAGTIFEHCCSGLRMCTEIKGIENLNSSHADNYKYFLNYADQMTTQLNVSSFDMSGAPNITSMFAAVGEISGLVDPVLGLDNWNVSTIPNAGNMAIYVTFSTPYYDRILTAWGAQTVQDTVDINFGNSKYSSEGVDGRNSLIAQGWTITDLGPQLLI